MSTLKWQHPFFIGLCIILLAFFFSAVKVSSTHFLRNNDFPAVSTSISMWNMAWGNQLRLDVSALGELKKYERREIMRAERFLATPRVAGVYFLIILFLMAWAFIVFFVHPELPESKIKTLSVGIASVFILFVLLTTHEIIHYRSLISKIETDGRLSDFFKIKPQFGFFLFLIGVITLFIGSFSDLRPRLRMATPAYRP